MLKKFFSFFKGDLPKSVMRDRWLLPTAEAEKWAMPDPAVYANQANLYRNLSYIRVAVDIVANSCVDADLDIIGVDEYEVEGHPFMALLDKPNGYDSRSEFLSAHFHYRVANGMSYWWLNRASANVPPDELWIIPPSKIIPVPDGRLGLRGYLYYPGNGAEIPLEAWEVVQFKSFNPFSRYLGLSLIESIALTAEGALAAQKWNTELFANNNARLPGILAFAEMIKDADWQRMKKEIGDSAAKRNNMMLRGVGKGGVEWMQASATQREMEFLGGLQADKQDIWDVFAPGLFNMLTSNASLANGQTGMAAFARYTLQPLLRETAEKITSELLPMYGGGVTAEYDDVVPEDKTIKLAQVAEFAKYHTVNEVRTEMFGNEPLEDERGELFVTQIQATSGVEQEEEPQEIPPQFMEQQPPASEDTETLEDELSDRDEMPEELKADLRRWKRKAVRAFGTAEALTFTDSHISPAMHAQIVDGLKAAKDKDAAAAVFDNVQAVKGDSLQALADAINRAVAVVITDAPKYSSDCQECGGKNYGHTVKCSMAYSEIPKEFWNGK